MTKSEANATAEMFRGIGGFGRVEAEQFGFDSGVYRVHLWIVNPKSGNRTLTIVKDLVASPKEAKLIAKSAKGKATDEDRAALARMAAERVACRD